MTNIKTRFISSLCILLVLSAVAGFAAAQDKEPGDAVRVAGPTGIFDAKTLKENLPELGLLPKGEVFFSKQGAFKISLPEQPYFIFPPQSQYDKNHRFIWFFKECDLSVQYEDLNAVGADKEFEEILADFKEGANITSITPFTLGEYRGHEAALDLKDKSKGISRIFRAGNRVYQLRGITDQSRPEALPLIMRVINTFEIVTGKDPKQAVQNP